MLYCNLLGFFDFETLIFPWDLELGIFRRLGVRPIAASTLQRLNRSNVLRLRMPGVMNFRAFRQQTFAATLAAPRETGSPALRAHARAKTVLILSGALGAL